MIKLVYCIRRRPEFTFEQFSEYWLQQHAPLVHSVAAAIGACRYVQSHTVAPDLNAMLQESRGLASAYDGITEVWWPDLAAFVHGMGTPEGQDGARRLLEDESIFIDFSRSRVFLTEEHRIFDFTN